MSALARIVSINAPSAAPAGTWVSVEATLQNVGDAPGYLRATMQYWEPQPPPGWDPLSVTSTDLGLLEPGATAVWSGIFIMTTWPGATGTTVRIGANRYGGLDGEGSEIWYRDDTRDVAIAIGTISGEISARLYWYPGLPGWIDLVATGIPTVPPGTSLSLIIGWVNRSTVAITGHVDLIVSRPDGSQVRPAAVAGQDWRASPGAGGTVQFAPVALDQRGAWTAKVDLSG